MKILLRALFSGSVASVLSGAAIAACSKAEAGAYVRGVNSTSQWLWEERAHSQHKPSWRYTGTGAVIHHTSSIFWAVLFEAAVAKKLPNLLEQKSPAALQKPVAKKITGKQLPNGRDETEHALAQHEQRSSDSMQPELAPSITRIFGTATLIAAVANLADFNLTPKRFTPGFERHLSRSSLAVVYGAFGLGLAAAAGWRELRNRDRKHRVEMNHRLDHQFDYDVIHYAGTSHAEYRHAH